MQMALWIATGLDWWPRATTSILDSIIFEVFAPTVRLSSIRVILALAALHDLC